MLEFAGEVAGLVTKGEAGPFGAELELPEGPVAGVVCRRITQVAGRAEDIGDVAELRLQIVSFGCVQIDAAALGRFNGIEQVVICSMFPVSGETRRRLLPKQTRNA